MKITRTMGELISSYSIAFTRAVSVEQVVDLVVDCVHDVQSLYHQGAITLEQADSMVDYFNSIAKDEEARI